MNFEFLRGTPTYYRQVILCSASKKDKTTKTEKFVSFKRMP